MDTIGVTYKYFDGTWLANSPDLKKLSGSILIAGGDSYEEAREQVAGVIPWALERDDIVIEHFVHEDSLPALIAERDHASAKPIAAAAKR